MNVTSDRADMATADGCPDVRPTPPAVSHPREELFSALVVYQQPELRAAVCEWLVRLGAGTVHEAASEAEARDRAQATGPCDLAVLDLGLPERSGIDLVEELRAQGWPRIVVLASSADPYAVRVAFQAGAQAYLLKSASPVVVTTGVRRVLELGGDATVVLAAGTRAPVATKAVELAPREVEALQLLAEGRPSTEVGEALGLPEPVVADVLSRIGGKLGTADPARMVALAERAGAVTTAPSAPAAEADLELLDRSSLGEPGVTALATRASAEAVDRVLALARSLDHARIRVPVATTGFRELTAREVEVLQLVADGCPDKQIAEVLTLSALAVKRVLARVRRKLGAEDRAHLVALALRAGVIR